MRVEQALVVRKCPSCGCAEGEVLFYLTREQFLYNNPAYNVDWFEGLDIPDNFEFPFVECGSCGFVYTKFRLDDKHNYDFYHKGIRADKSKEKIFEKSKRLFNIQVWLDLVKVCPDKWPIKVLDYGAGWGDFLSVAQSYGVDVFGLEFDGRKIGYAGEHGVRLGDHVFVEENAPYDIFICNQVLEHLADPRGSLRHLRSLLQGHAVGYVSVPNFNSQCLERSIDLIKRGLIPPKEINPFGHLNYFSPESLRKMLKEAEFDVINPGAIEDGLSHVSSWGKLLSGGKKRMKSRLNPTALFVRAI